jgi:hypothetical protein
VTTASAHNTESSKSPAMVHRQKKNSLPKGQLSGVTCGKIHGWKKVTRSIDTGILRLCCCLPAQNTHPRFRNKVAQ